MTDESKELTPEELEQANGDQLPDREAMSLIPLPDPIGGPTLPVEPPGGGEGTLPVEPPASQ